MQYNKIVKAIAGILAISLVLSAKSIQASAEWRHDSIGWWNTEGTSYSIGWRYINGSWYYFYPDSYYNDKGYMAHDTIIDGYYLNGDGAWSDGSQETQTYIKLLNDTNWQKNNGIIFDNGKSTINNVIIIDINQDGVFEMILYHGTCSANYKVSVVMYNNGNINIKHITTFSGGYLGYSKSSKMFFVTGGNMGTYYTDGYKIENGQCKKAFSSADVEIYSRNSESLVIEGHNYTVNGQEVSSKEYDKFFKEFGQIEK